MIDRLGFGACLALAGLLPISNALAEILAVTAITCWLIQVSKGRASVRGPDRAILILWLVWMGLTIIWSSDRTLSANTWIEKHLEYAGIYVAVQAFVSSAQRWRKMHWAILGSLAIVTIDALLQLILGRDPLRGLPVFAAKITGPFPNPNGLGAFMAGVVPIGLAWWATMKRPVRQWGELGVIITLVVVALTFSAGAALGLVSGLLALLCLAKRRQQLQVGLLLVKAALLGGVGIFIFLTVRNVWDLLPGVQSRLELWQLAKQMAWERRWIGHGVGTFMQEFTVFPAAKEYSPSYAHNCYLQIWAETGLIGLLGFLGFLAMVGWLAFRRWPHADQEGGHLARAAGVAAVIAILANSFVDVNLYSLRLAMQFWLMIALVGAPLRAWRS